MQRLVHADEVAQAVFLDHAAHVADVRHAEDLAPAGALVEHFQVLRTVDVGCRVVKVRPCRQLQHEPAAQLEQRENRHISGGNRHRAVEVFPHPVDGVHREGRYGAALQQLHLVRLFLLAEIADGVFPCPLFPGEDQVQVYNPVHFVFNPHDVLPVQFDTRQADEHAVADGVFNPHLLIGVEMPQREQHHKTEGTLVNPASFLVFQRQGRQRAVPAQRIVQLNHDAAGQRGQRAPRKSIQRLQAVPDGGSFREFFLVVHGTDNHCASSFG